MIIDDSDQMAWLHSPERQDARSAALLRLLRTFGASLLTMTPLPMHRVACMALRMTMYRTAIRTQMAS